MKGGSDHDHDRYLNTLEIFDTETNEWSLSEATMKNRRAGCCAVTDGATITVIGGRDENNDVLAIEEYDIEKDEWRPSSSYCSLEDGRSEFGAMLSGSNLIVVGGIRDNNRSMAGILDSVQICKNASNSALSMRKEIESSNNTSNLKTPTRYNKRGRNKALPIGKNNQVSTSAGKQKGAELSGRKKQKTATNQVAASLEFQVAKVFDDVVHFGTAMKKNANAKYWDVVYDDGDGEQFDNTELNEGKKLFENTVRKKDQTRPLNPTHHALFGEERFISFEKAKDLMKTRIEHFETILFGQVRAGCLIDRFSYLEKSMEIVPRSDLLRKERLDSLEKVIVSKSETIARHEMDLFGETKTGSLEERLTKLQEWQL